MIRKTGVALAAGLILAVSAQAQAPLKFTAHLEGFNLAGQPVATNATGQATLEVINDGTAVRYHVNIVGISNLWMAHIHVAPAPVKITDPVGPIAFWFAPTTPPAAPAGVNIPERLDGNLASGLIYSDAQLVGPLTPDPGNAEGTGVRGLIKAMLEGRASIVVHTNDFDPQTPGGVAGDSPPGEIRGTIR